jgi:4'-phosphopantetheinyl transferase
MNPPSTNSSWPLMTGPLVLSHETVHVVRVELQTDDATLDRLKRLLSPDEVARADRYKVPQPRCHFIVCRAVLRRLLGSCLNCHPTDVAFEYGPQGKPALQQSLPQPQRIEFSVSHSADQALIAITLGRLVGVDIERMDPKVSILKLAQRFFSPREAAELANLPERDQLAGFYRGWTCKESYLKATGFGLSFPLNKFSVSLDPNQSPALIEVIDQPEELERWRLSLLNPLPVFAAAIMFAADATESVALRQWSADANALAR